MKSKKYNEMNKFSLDEIDELKMFVVVCKPDVEKSIIDRINMLGGRVFFSKNAEGVSKDKKMELLGIQTVKNIVVFAVARNSDAKNLLVALDAEYNFSGPGNGLGFVIDIDGYTGAKGLFVK